MFGYQPIGKREEESRKKPCGKGPVFAGNIIVRVRPSAEGKKKNESRKSRAGKELCLQEILSCEYGRPPRTHCPGKARTR